MAKQSVGAFLAALRKAHGYTQQEVADRLSVSNRTVSSWECDSALPDILLLPALAELYGVTADEILAGERNTEAAPRPVLSQKSERKLLKRKRNDYFTRSLILFGVYTVGLLLFFIGLYVELTTFVWVGWKWWLLLLFLGLAAFLVCAVCILALWKNAETSADEEAEGYGAFCLLLRRRVALLSDLSAGISLLFGTVCGVTIAAGTAAAAAFAVAAAAFFLLAVGKFSFGVLLVHRSEKKFGEEGAQLAARNAKRYKKCALFCLIPVLAGGIVLALFGLWQPETRVPVFEAALDEFTADIETLTCEVHEKGELKSVEYPFALSALAKTAAEGESYDLGSGFSCTFRDGMETCCIKSKNIIDLGFYQGVGDTFYFYRLHAEEGEYSVYNLKYSGYAEKVTAVDWRGKELPQRLCLAAEEGRAKLLRCFREDDFPLAAPIALSGMLLGVGACVLVCALKRERLNVKL